MASKRLSKSFILAFLLVFATLIQASAQKKDSADVASVKDTAVKKKKKHPYPYPKKAMIYSAILPGLGQAYNKKYWKIPIIYAGLGTMAYFISFNEQEYTKYYSALKTRTAGGIDPYYTIYSSSDLVTIENYYHRYRDLSVIGAAFIYILNIVDANVDAQLHSFDVSDNLSLHITPQLYTDPLSGKCGIQPGLCLVKRF